MTRDIPDRVRASLLSGIDELEAKRTRSMRDLWRAALALEHVILSDLLSAEEERAVLHGMESDRTRSCQETFCALETLIENSFATLTLTGGEAQIRREDSITENYLSRYEELARREIALAEITSGDHVRFIGSGPFPITAIEYARQTGCTVECVDFVREAVDTSREVLRRLDIRGITCQMRRGEDLPATDCSVILVGVLARPKQEIFDMLDATCPTGCRVLARTTFGLRTLIYEPAVVDEDRLRTLRRDGVHEARGDQVISSWLYKRGR